VIQKRGARVTVRSASVTGAQYESHGDAAIRSLHASIFPQHAQRHAAVFMPSVNERALLLRCYAAGMRAALFAEPMERQ